MEKLVISYSKKRRGRKRKREKLPEDVQRLKRVCQFCLSEEDNEVNFGTIFEKEDVIVHYFCMLLSSGLCQNTRDNDKKSILGFVLSDIKKELQRGSRLKCCFCHIKGATIGCCVKTCRKVFHLSCGREHGTMHQFFDSFRSYCDNHRLEQEVPKEVSRQNPSKRICSICLCPVTSFASCDAQISPCCQKSVFHRKCLQEYALSAGMHYFKCPLCNSVEEFQAHMMKYGIYIPDQDASWEREPNAYHELLERHNSCDISECVCPQGRMFDADSGKYELLLCGWCGAFGSHRVCKGLVRRGIYLVCCDCADIVDKAEKKHQEQKEYNHQQKDLALHRTGVMSRNSLHQKELDEQSPTGSTVGSTREQALPENHNSPKPKRKMQCIDQSPTGLKGRKQHKKHSHMSADSGWRQAIESNQQHSESFSPGPSKEKSGSSLQGGQSSRNQDRCTLKCSEEVTAVTETMMSADLVNKMFIHGRDFKLLDCKVKLRKIDSEVGFKFGWKSDNHFLHLSCTQMCSRNLEPVATDIHNEKKYFQEMNKLRTKEFDDKTTILGSGDEKHNCLAVKSPSINYSSDETPLKIIHEDSIFLQLTEAISGHEIPPLIQEIIYRKPSPKKHKAKKKYSVAISNGVTQNISEILIGQISDVEYAHEPVLQTSSSFVKSAHEKTENLQHNSVCSSFMASVSDMCTTNISYTEEKCGTEGNIKNKTTVPDYNKQLCQTVIKEEVPIIEQDVDMFRDSSAQSTSVSLLSSINLNIDCDHKNTSASVMNIEHAGFKCHDVNRVLTQTDIFGKVAFSTFKKRRKPKSKDSSAFAGLFQSKIRNFLKTT